MKKLIFIIGTFTMYLHADLVILHSSTNNEVRPANIKYLEKIQKVADKNKINIKFKAIPWKRGLLLIKTGKADGIVNASFKEDRAVYAVYPMKDDLLDASRRLNPGKSYSIYKNKNSTIKWDGEKFSNVDGFVAAIDSYAVNENLKTHKNIKVINKNDRMEIIRDLESNKISAYAGLTTDVEFILEKYPVFRENIIKEPIPIRKKDYYLIFSKKIYSGTKKNEIELIWNGLKNK